jgi:hypothetical protein
VTESVLRSRPPIPTRRVGKAEEVGVGGRGMEGAVDKSHLRCMRADLRCVKKVVEPPLRNENLMI